MERSVNPQYTRFVLDDQNGKRMVDVFVVKMYFCGEIPYIILIAKALFHCRFRV